LNGVLPVIIMDDASKNISTTNYSFINSPWRRYREVLTQASVWSGMVVILDILFENEAKVVFILKQDMVETSSSNPTYPPFSIRLSMGILR